MFTYARSCCGAETGGFRHSRSATARMFIHTQSRHGWICHFLRPKMVWRVRFRSKRRKLGVGPISCGADFAPAPRQLMCERMSWFVLKPIFCPLPPASAPLMCERTLRHQCPHVYFHITKHDVTVMLAMEIWLKFIYTFTSNTLKIQHI